MSITHLVRIPAQAEYQYPVVIGPGALDYLTEINTARYSKIFILTDTVVENLWLEAVLERIPTAMPICIPPGESHKSLSVLESIWHSLLSSGADRKSLLLNLGGGVIGDMGGFAAATFMRGMDFIQLPTTVLAQVDASVGGKLAVDFHSAKNCIGIFTQPLAVIADTDTLVTLPAREFNAGFAEILKHGLIADSEYWSQVTSRPASEFAIEELASIIERSVAIKARIVEEDEHETGLRKILNFGHTAGHAIESLSLERDADAALLHGEAIAIGMVVEATIAVEAGLLNNTTVDILREKLLLHNLPVRLTNTDWSPSEILKRMKHDKKNSNGVIHWSLISAIGSAQYDCILEDSLVLSILHDFIQDGA